MGLHPWLIQISLVSVLSLLLVLTGCKPSQNEQNKNAPKEIVLSEGMKICAKTNNASICVSSIGGNKRSIKWDGNEYTITLIPRKKRWHGKLGLVSPKQPNNLWKAQEGIIRALIQESWIRFDNTESTLKAIHFPGSEDDYNMVYNDNGLLIQWHISNLPDQKVLDLMIFQILINGKKPKQLSGSMNKYISVSYH